MTPKASFFDTKSTKDTKTDETFRFRARSASWRHPLAGLVGFLDVDCACGA
jgi:hypothetical protein